MLDILQVTTFFTEYGGVEKSVSDLCHGLSHKHSVRVLCTTQGKSTNRVSGRVSVSARGGLMSLSGRPFSPTFAAELHRAKADIIHYHLPCPMAALAQPFVNCKSKIMIATWHHDLVRHKLFNAVSRPFVERLLHQLDAIIVTAPAAINTTPLLRQFARKCHVVPLGIDHEKLAKCDADAVLAARARYGTPLLLFVGRLVYYKGCEVLLESMSNIPNANLVMVGTGPLMPELQKMISTRGLEQRVHLLGWQSDDGLRTLFQACDAFVLPSTLPTECFGLVQVEAMLSGKPVINTNLPTGVPWVSLHKETGLTVTPGSAPELTEAIKALLSDAQLRKSLGANAKTRALENFTLHKQIAATELLYEQLLSKASQKSSLAIR